MLGMDKREKEMITKELQQIISALDTRITTINDRTKSHTIQIRELSKKIELLENPKKAGIEEGDY